MNGGFHPSTGLDVPRCRRLAAPKPANVNNDEHMETLVLVGAKSLAIWQRLKRVTDAQKSEGVVTRQDGDTSGRR